MKKKTFRLNKETVARLDDQDINSVAGGCGITMICPTLLGCTITCPTIIGCTLVICQRQGDELVGGARACPVDGGPVEIGPVDGRVAV